MQVEGLPEKAGNIAAEPGIPHEGLMVFGGLGSLENLMNRRCQLFSIYWFHQ